MRKCGAEAGIRTSRKWAFHRSAKVRLRKPECHFHLHFSIPHFRTSRAPLPGIRQSLIRRSPEVQSWKSRSQKAKAQVNAHFGISDLLAATSFPLEDLAFGKCQTHNKKPGGAALNANHCAS